MVRIYATVRAFLICFRFVEIVGLDNVIGCHPNDRRSWRTWRPNHFEQMRQHKRQSVINDSVLFYQHWRGLKLTTEDCSISSMVETLVREH